MFEFHTDLDRYFTMQYLTARDYIIPFLKDKNINATQKRVLELGCAEAGVLKAFVEAGSFCMGIDLDATRVENAKKLQADAVSSGKLKFSTKNVYDIDVDKDLQGKFDIIILKDVIEHIPNQEKFIPFMKDFLIEGGVIFFGFPPWQMPFGGHQQILGNKYLSKLPWFHLLPNFIYGNLVEKFTNKESKDGMLEIKSTGISIERFEKIIKNSGLNIIAKKSFLFNPIYKYKFGLEVRSVAGIFSKIPYLRNFYTTAVYYIVKN
ncbi:MAG: methyltransferase domain-containing protein [Saprospiraceae bacterium]|nr:methyltransferase domain-containing protein [Saprospiraceae bacterium]